MKEVAKLYRRLTRATPSIASYNSLWLGPDHLLILSSTGYHETYRRIQFSDIQAIFTLESERRSSWALVWGVVSGICALVLVASLITGRTPVFSAAFTAMGLVALLWNHLLGPGCHVHLITNACGGFFCRECVVDHGGRLLCSSCLAKAGAQKTKATARGRRLRRGFTLGAAGIVAWLAFYLTGGLLLKLPPDLHATEKWEPAQTEAEP